MIAYKCTNVFLMTKYIKTDTLIYQSLYCKISIPTDTNDLKMDVF